ncbi:hypothetical protein LUZ60_003158 [Juncus effusus]|nr:hypothetical protein LUZ60_003158 [Juncus effusus]
MKGTNLHKFSATRVSFALIIIVFAIIVISSWERNPLPNSFHLSSNQFLSIPKEFASSFTNASFYQERETDDREEDVTNSQECNFGKGKWVPDERRPLYSGSECKMFLSRMWACNLMHKRTDFSFEKFKWQPKDCQMPSFSGPKFLKRMRNKTLAFIGDSLGRQQFQSLLCMITGGKPDPLVTDVGPEFDLVKKPGAIRPDGWAYRFDESNTTVLFYWSASLCELEPVWSNGSGLGGKPVSFKLHLDRPVGFLTTYLHRFDVLVLNTGHHWNRGKFQGNNWIMHASGKPVINTTLYDLTNAKNLTLRSISKYLDSQIAQNPNLKVFLRTLSPRHFSNGDWNTGGSCNNTIPLANGDEVALEMSSDDVAERAVNGLRVKLLDITGLSRLRDEAHISKYSLKGINEGASDCLHWCLPGVPDTWNEILFAQI